MQEILRWLDLGKGFFPQYSEGELQKNIENYTNTFESDLGPDWMSLVLLTTLMHSKGVSYVNSWAVGSGVRDLPVLKSISAGGVHKTLPENIPYRYWLYSQMDSEIFHLSPQQREELKEKALLWQENLEKNTPELGPSLESPTNVSFWIEGEIEDSPAQILFQTHYMNDLAVNTTFNPVRDQLIRMIDAVINNFRIADRDLRELWIFLVSPSAFKPDGMGPVPSSPLRLFPGASFSRLFAYKIKEYIKPDVLKSLLPHWCDAKLLKAVHPDCKPVSDQEWRLISNRIGWVTLEGFTKHLPKYCDGEILELAKKYFSDRGMYHLEEKRD